MLQNAYFLAKIGGDTAENEQHFAEICQPLSDVSDVFDVLGGGRPRDVAHEDSFVRDSHHRRRAVHEAAALDRD